MERQGVNRGKNAVKTYIQSITTYASVPLKKNHSVISINDSTRSIKPWIESMDAQQ